MPVQQLQTVAVSHRTSRAGDPHRHIHFQIGTRVWAPPQTYSSAVRCRWMACKWARSYRPGIGCARIAPCCPSSDGSPHRCWCCSCAFGS
ncbi:relaxase domain-containing protein [Microbacterium sp.]|uniref:relaxase domain-containing protein n=1 Tax=Microbacterium sp. TaxID=51671 RepID=UPI0037C9C539